MVVGAATLLTEWAHVTLTDDWHSLVASLGLVLALLVEELVISLLVKASSAF